MLYVAAAGVVPLLLSVFRAIRYSRAFDMYILIFISSDCLVDGLWDIFWGRFNRFVHMNLEGNFGPCVDDRCYEGLYDCLKRG